MQGKDETELAALLQAAIAGDEKAYSLFLQRIAVLIRCFARRRIISGGVDAEDVVQETLLAIHLKRHTWITNAPVMPWIYAIARFKLIDAFRRRGRRVAVDLDDIAETLAHPQVETVGDRDISRVLNTLVAGQKAVVFAVSADGRSIGETAQRLGMSETAVRTALHRGLAAIAKRFGQT